MAAIVYQKDKRSGITYAYESISFWDKEKKQSRSRWTLIGRVDNITGEIVPTDGRNRKKTEAKSSLKQDKSATGITRHTFFGTTYLLDALEEKSGITNDLKQCFPDNYK